MSKVKDYLQILRKNSILYSSTKRTKINKK